MGQQFIKHFLRYIDKERVVRNKLFIDDTIKNSGLQPLADAILNDCGVSIFDYTDAFIEKCKKVKPLKLSRDFTSEECQTIVDEYYKALDAAYLNHIKKFAEKRGIDLAGSVQEQQAQDEVVQNARRDEIRAEKAVERRKEFEKKVKVAIDNKICDLNNILLNYADGRGMQRYVYERVTHTLLSFNYKAYMIVVSKGKSKIKYVGSDCELHNLADAMFFATDSDEKLLEFASAIKEKYPDWYVSVENLDISCLRDVNASDYERSIVGNTYDSESIITYKLDEAEAYLVQYLNTEYGSKHSRAVTTMATLFKQTGADTLRYVVFYRNGAWHYVRRADLLKAINNDFVRGVSTMSVDNIGYAVDDDEVRILCDIAKNVYGTNDYRICTISRSDIAAIDDVIAKFNDKKINALVNMKTTVSSLKEDMRFTSKSKLLIRYSYDRDDCYLYRFGERKDGRRIKWSRLTGVISESVCISNDDATDVILNDALYEFIREHSTGYVYEIVSMDDIQSVVPN